MGKESEKTRQRKCYQKHLKYIFGENWREHYNDNDRKEYVVGVKKAVEQVDKKTGEVVNVFKSLAEAERFFNFRPGGSAIGKVCRGERKSAIGYLWRYKVA